MGTSIKPISPFIVSMGDIGYFKEGEVVNISLLPNPADQVYTPMTMNSPDLAGLNCGLSLAGDTLTGTMKFGPDWVPGAKMSDPTWTGDNYNQGWIQQGTYDTQFTVMYNYIIPGVPPVPMIGTYTIMFSLVADYDNWDKEWKKRWQDAWNDKLQDLRG